MIQFILFGLEAQYNISVLDDLKNDASVRIINNACKQVSVTKSGTKNISGLINITWTSSYQKFGKQGFAYHSLKKDILELHCDSNGVIECVRIDWKCCQRPMYKWIHPSGEFLLLQLWE